MTSRRFDGYILGVGTASGTRLVIGMWGRTPFGPLVDVMIENVHGQRTLLAPTRRTADFISATYAFDDVRVEPIELRRDGRDLRVTSPSLTASMRVGRRTAIGVLLSLVPRPLARARWWLRLIDPLAARLRAGVHTHGSAGSGRHEFYCALDERRVQLRRAVLDGADLGAMAPLDPPVRFGFASAPRTPSVVRVTTFVDAVSADGLWVGDCHDEPER